MGPWVHSCNIKENVACYVVSRHHLLPQWVFSGSSTLAEKPSLSGSPGSTGIPWKDRAERGFSSWVILRVWHMCPGVALSVQWDGTVAPLACLWQPEEFPTFLGTSTQVKPDPWLPYTGELGWSSVKKRGGLLKTFWYGQGLLRGGLVVKSTCSFCRGPRFGFQHRHGDLQSSLIPGLGDLRPSLGLCRHQVHAQ